MPDEPKPLREALKEAIQALEDEAFVTGNTDGDRGYDALAEARRDVYALLLHIPIDLEAREGDEAN